jgi:NADH-quinone oxidoreductase subunit A
VLPKTDSKMSASAAFEPLLWMLLFGVVASVPALIVAKMIAPRRRFWNPVKYMPMECGQVPSGEGRTRFMMQYYSYVLMFVAFDVILIFLYAWGVSLFALPRSVTLPILVFLAIIGAAMGYAMYLSSRRDIW